MTTVQYGTRVKRIENCWTDRDQLRGCASGSGPEFRLSYRGSPESACVTTLVRNDHRCTFPPTHRPGPPTTGTSPSNAELPQARPGIPTPISEVTNQVSYVHTRRPTHYLVPLLSPKVRFLAVAQSDKERGHRTPFLQSFTITADQPSVIQMTVDLLPDDALLVIFDFFLDVPPPDDVDGWHILVHVCQRWRNVVLSSPRRLNLRLLCTDRRPVKEMLDIWPAFPIIIRGRGYPVLLDDEADNIIAALEHPGRVREIRLVEVPGSLLEILAATTEVSFPALETLELRLDNEWAPPVLPDSFFGESVPRLRVLDLTGLPYLAVRNLLLSASGLVYLCLWDMPISGYVSPKAIATCLSSMTKLESIELGFRSSVVHLKQASQLAPPITRVLLPVLAHFLFQGTNVYLEELMACLDVPSLDDVTVIKPTMVPIRRCRSFIPRQPRCRRDHDLTCHG